MTDLLLSLIEQAGKKIRKFHQDARFCSASQQGFYEDSPWTFTFRLPAATGKRDRTATLLYAVGRFDVPPQVYEEPPEGVRDITQPLTIGLEEAEKVLHDHGIHGVITHVELSWPKFPGVNQPYYMFESGNDVWYIGARDGKFHETPIGTEQPVVA